MRDYIEIELAEDISAQEVYDRCKFDGYSFCRLHIPQVEHPSGANVEVTGTSRLTMEVQTIGHQFPLILF